MHYKNTLIKLILILALGFNIGVPQTFAFSQTSTEEKVFEDDFKSRYSGRKYNYEGRKIIGNSASHEEGAFSDFENNQDPTIKEEVNKDEISINNNLSWLFIIILIVAVVYLAVTLLNEGNTGWFSTKRNTSLADHKSFNVDTASNDDFIALISKAEEQNNYRLAIRYYFLFILKTMSSKNLIKIEEDKTNSEYLREINNQKIENQFSSALYIFNYTWYGEFEVNKLQYKAAKTSLKSFLKHLRK